MEQLSGEALADMMQRCNQYPQYRAAVLFGSNARLREFAASIVQNISWEDHGIESVSRTGAVKFTNGSTIKPYIADQPRLRGVRVNEILYDAEEVSIENAPKFLTVGIYHCAEGEEEIKPTSENDLDAFLNGFKIICG